LDPGPATALFFVSGRGFRFFVLASLVIRLLVGVFLVVPRKSRLQLIETNVATFDKTDADNPSVAIMLVPVDRKLLGRGQSMMFRGRSCLAIRSRLVSTQIPAASK